MELSLEQLAALVDHIKHNPDEEINEHFLSMMNETKTARDEHSRRLMEVLGMK